MPPNTSELNRVVAEFVAEVNAAYGLYLDATAGFAGNVRMATLAQEQAAATDDSPFYYGRGAPTDPENVLLHQTTYGAFKSRNEKTGRNYILLARFLVVLLYELWETRYRDQIASAAGVRREELQIPIFGDLRLLRHQILHNKGRLSQDTAKKLEVVSAPTTQNVDLDGDGVYRLVSHIRASLDNLVLDFTGDDPVYRTIWRIS
jgi:hypothetical protein